MCIRDRRLYRTERQSARMSKIKNSGLDQYGLNPSNSSYLEYLALKGLTDSSKFLHRFKAYDTYSYHLSPNVYCYFLRTLVYSACLVKVFCSAWFWKKSSYLHSIQLSMKQTRQNVMSFRTFYNRCVARGDMDECPICQTWKNVFKHSRYIGLHTSTRRRL